MDMSLKLHKFPDESPPHFMDVLCYCPGASAQWQVLYWDAEYPGWYMEGAGYLQIDSPLVPEYWAVLPVEDLVSG